MFIRTYTSFKNNTRIHELMADPFTIQVEVLTPKKNRTIILYIEESERTNEFRYSTFRWKTFYKAAPNTVLKSN